MDADIKAVVTTLYREVRKDIPFFGICGGVVGWLMVVQYRLKQNDVAPKDSWADALFSDFISFNAFGLVFVGLLGLGALVTCLGAARVKTQKLERVVAHLEARSAQLSSSIISFTLGLSVFAVVHSGVTMTAGGAALAALILLFNGLVVVGFISASLVARRNPPFDRWWVGSVMLLLAIGAIAWFVARGAK